MFTLKNKVGKILGVSEVWEEGYELSYSIYGTDNMVLKPSMACNFFNKVKVQRDKLTYKTGFDLWDKIFNGGLHSGLYVLGAVPGLGKTTLALQMGCNIAQNKNHVVFLSLEMSSSELYSKNLSNLSFKQQDEEHKPLDSQYFLFGEDVYSKEDNKLNPRVYSLMDAYKNEIDNYLNIICCTEQKDTFSTNDIERILINYNKVHKTKPVLIIDYLQMLEAYDVEEDFNSKRLEMNRVVKDLKTFSRKYDVPIIVISSITRSSYSKDSDDSEAVYSDMSCFKETGNIEYTADALIVLTKGKSTKSLLKDKPTVVNVNILKNRFGPNGRKFALNFIPQFAYFEEIEGND